MTYNRRLDLRPVQYLSFFCALMKYAILIDGGFARRKLGTSKKPATKTDIINLVEKIKNHDALKNHDLHRVYFYDAFPLSVKEKMPLQGGMIDFSTTPLASRTETLFSELKKEPFFAMRMGETSFQGWTVRSSVLNKKADSVSISKDDVKPKISQKGVDMRIGMDIAALTLKGIVQILVLVTGDSDFIPAMKFARREGANLYLVALGHQVKESVLEHSDLSLEIES